MVFAFFIGVILAYIIGSLPTAFIFGVVSKGIDIREHGSGNVGATNVFRVVGKKQGIIVLIIDFLKGVLAVSLIPILIGRFINLEVGVKEILLIVLGAGVIAGHIWTIFLKFKGGKGVATTAGVLGGIAPEILIITFLVFVVIFSIFRYVSLGSVSAAATLPISSVIFGKDLYFVLFCSVLSIIAILKHKSNIKRLIRGEEKKLF